MSFLSMLSPLAKSGISSNFMTMIGKSSARQIAGIRSMYIKHETATLLSPHRDSISCCAILKSCLSLHSLWAGRCVSPRFASAIWLRTTESHANTFIGTVLIGRNIHYEWTICNLCCTSPTLTRIRIAFLFRLSPSTIPFWIEIPNSKETDPWMSMVWLAR